MHKMHEIRPIRMKYPPNVIRYAQNARNTPNSYEIPPKRDTIPTKHTKCIKKAPKTPNRMKTYENVISPPQTHESIIKLSITFYGLLSNRI